MAKYYYWFWLILTNIFTAICKVCKYVNLHSVPDVLPFQCLCNYAITWNEQVKCHQHWKKCYYPCSAETISLARGCKICNTDTQRIHRKTSCAGLRQDLRSDVSLHVQGQMIRTRETPENKTKMIMYRSKSVWNTVSDHTHTLTCRSGCIWRVWLRCVFWSASSVHHFERSATRSHPTNTCMASHLQATNKHTTTLTI